MHIIFGKLKKKTTQMHALCIDEMIKYNTPNNNGNTAIKRPVNGIQNFSTQ